MRLSVDQVKRARAAAIAADLPGLHTIIHEVCDLMGADVATVKGYQKTPFLHSVRVQIYLCAREAGYSYPVIARIMGGRDHTTVMSAVQKAKALQDNAESAKIEAGRGLRQQLPDPDRNRDTQEVRDNG